MYVGMSMDLLTGWDFTKPEDRAKALSDEVRGGFCNARSALAGTRRLRPGRTLDQRK